MSSADLVAQVERWVGSDALQSVITVCGGSERNGQDLASWLAYLEEFTECWDFRAGKERNQVESQQLADDVEHTVLAAATALGMRGATDPPRTGYDHLVVLGGLARACITRPRHAAALLASGTVRTPHVVALSGFRSLTGTEADMAREFLAIEAADEFRVMDAGLRAAFSLGEPSSVDGEHSDVLGAAWAIHAYGADELKLHVAAAPSTEPGVRRANTPDTYLWLAEKSGWIAKGETVLVITTAIYRPYQHADAARILTLSHGIDVDVIGVEPGYVDPRLALPFTAPAYLQEMRSGISSFSRLHRAAIG